MGVLNVNKQNYLPPSWEFGRFIIAICQFPSCWNYRSAAEQKVGCRSMESWRALGDSGVMQYVSKHILNASFQVLLT